MPIMVAGGLIKFALWPWLGHSAAIRQAGGRMIYARLVLAALVIALAGCAPRPDDGLLLPAAPENLSPHAQEVTVMTISNRNRTGPDGQFYGTAHSEMHREEFVIAVAPAREDTGSLLFDRDLSRDFAVVSRRALDAPDWHRALRAQHRTADQPIVLFVHGYNQTFQESLFRLAQISAGMASEVQPILFSWPSQASLMGYVADRDSATVARDDLAQLLRDLHRNMPNRDIMIAGHSMGSWLVMEVLRDLRRGGENRLLRRIQVGLAAPDIDVAVFRSQMAAVGQLSRPLTILVSQDDIALGMSGRLAEQRTRLGALDASDPQTIALAEELGVRIIDVSAFPAADDFHHERFLALAAFHPQSAMQASIIDQLRFAGAYILDTSGQVLRREITDDF